MGSSDKSILSHVGYGPRDGMMLSIYGPKLVEGNVLLMFID